MTPRGRRSARRTSRSLRQRLSAVLAVAAAACRCSIRRARCRRARCALRRASARTSPWARCRRRCATRSPTRTAGPRRRERPDVRERRARRGVHRRRASRRSAVRASASAGSPRAGSRTPAGRCGPTSGVIRPVEALVALDRRRRLGRPLRAPGRERPAERVDQSAPRLGRRRPAPGRLRRATATSTCLARRARRAGARRHQRRHERAQGRDAGHAAIGLRDALLGRRAARLAVGFRHIHVAFELDVAYATISAATTTRRTSPSPVVTLAPATALWWRF